ncbi:MAG TPA: hypothetical protein VKI19_15710 [Acidimicrobiales bacterium]|nr:hypothetical protein [Acidimicrobiales bacterium]
MADEPNAIDLVSKGLDVVDKVIKMTCSGDANIKIEEGGFAHCYPPGFHGVLEGGQTKIWQMFTMKSDSWPAYYEWHMTASWEFRKKVRTADKGLWGNFIDTATIQVAMPNASLHLAWEWMVHFPGQSSWQDTEAGTVELPFLIDVKCYDTLVTKTFEWGQGWRGALRGDGSATLTPT